MTDISELVGKTFNTVEERKDHGEDELVFLMEDGSGYKFHHVWDCCESVNIEEIVGDLKDLEGVPLVQAEEVSNYEGPEPEYADSYTWTFYKFATIKGYVTVRWLGQSNGYYSEDVSLSEVEKD